MDLLSVLMHEMGHLLGLEHGDHEEGVMFETLAAGERHGAVDDYDAALLAVLGEWYELRARPKRAAFAETMFDL